jgi:hypothetical protein
LSSVRSEGEQRSSRSEPAGERRNSANWLLLIPILAVVFPWVYDTRDPELIGIPFFYWYQMLWVPLSVVFTVAVYRLTRKGA